MTVDTQVDPVEQSVNDELNKVRAECNIMATESFTEEAAEGEVALDDYATYSKLNELASNNVDTFTEVSNLLAVSDGLESLYKSLLGNESLSDSDKALLHTANQNTAQAFGVGVEGIDLGLEFAGPISLGVIIVGLWKAIKKLISLIWDHIEDLTKLLDRTIPNMRKGFEEIVALVPRISHLPSNGKPIELGPEGRYIRVGAIGSIPDADLLSKEYETLADIGKLLLKDHAAQLVNIGLGVYNGLTSFNLNDPTIGLADLDKLVQERSTDVFHGIDLVQRPVTVKHPLAGLANSLGLSQSDSPRFKGGVNKSATFLGKQSFYLVEKELEKKERDIASANLDSLAYQGLSINFLPDEIFTNKIPNSFTIEAPLNLNHVVQICDNGLKLLDYIEDVKGPKLLGRIDYARKAIEKRTLEMNAHVTKMDVFSPDAIAHYRTALLYNVAYAQWTNDPFSNFISHSINVSRVMLKVCSKTINSYLKP